jgi:hypothetical protein
LFLSDGDYAFFHFFKPNSTNWPLLIGDGGVTDSNYILVVGANQNSVEKETPASDEVVKSLEHMDGISSARRW